MVVVGVMESFDEHDDFDERRIHSRGGQYDQKVDIGKETIHSFTHTSKDRAKDSSKRFEKHTHVDFSVLEFN